MSVDVLLNQAQRLRDSRASCPSTRSAFAPVKVVGFR